MKSPKKAVKLYMIETSAGIVFYTVREVVKDGVIREVIELEGVV
jgi:hypothetical protein